MWPSSISSSDAVAARPRPFVPIAACAFAAFFALDLWLHDGGGFARTFGAATQEGQILSKVERAPGMARVADVVLLGSSFVRSGIAGEPFLERGLLPWNFGISGGGPLTDYFALKRIRKALAGRPGRPTIVVELKDDAIVRQRDTLWAEYPQYLGIVRHRGEMIAEAPLVFRVLRAYGMTSQYVSSLVVPSGIYRSYASQVALQPELLHGYFYGMEDFSGYAPLHTLLGATLRSRAASLVRPPIAPADLVPGKMEGLRRVMALARELRCPVLLFESPTIVGGRDSGRYRDVVAQLRTEAPDVDVLHTADYALTFDDFDEGGHPNIRGADALARAIAARVRPAAADSLDTRLDRAFLRYAMPPLSAWSRDDRIVAHDAGGALQLQGGTAATPLLARSPGIAVDPDRECVLEARLRLARGQLLVRVVWRNPRTGAEEAGQMLTPPALARFGQTRIVLRAVPRAREVRIELVDYSASAGAAASEAEFSPLRLWANR